MKKILVLAALFCLCFQATAVFAAIPNFAGDWELDLIKSKLPETMTIESMTMKVAQTEKELKIESTTKRAQGNVRSGTGSPMRRGGGGTQIISYNLDGKETNADIGSGAMAGKEMRKASLTSDGKLSLTLTRNISNETGSITIKTNETWELMDEGKTLKVVHYMETPRGATNAELYFTKKDSGVLTVKGDYNVSANSANDTNKTPKRINAGVMNGKAVSLPKPPYPAEARAAGASGTVNVKVTFDEAGNVISAEAISGDVLLRDVCVEAAKKAKFTPTRISGNPVQVTGIVVYNFVP